MRRLAPATVVKRLTVAPTGRSPARRHPHRPGSCDPHFPPQAAAIGRVHGGRQARSMSSATLAPLAGPSTWTAVLPMPALPATPPVATGFPPQAR